MVGRATGTVMVLALAACGPALAEAPPPEQRVVLTEASAAEAPPLPPASRPRLSRTVTLGESSAESSYAVAQAPAAPGAPAVVVQNNNQVTVIGGGAPYAYYAGYGGYGHAPRRDGGTAPMNRSWGTSGWEGPRRTAAPGQTPGVAGNWAPAPSYGPAPMK